MALGNTHRSASYGLLRERLNPTPIQQFSSGFVFGIKIYLLQGKLVILFISFHFFRERVHKQPGWQSEEEGERET